MRPLDGRRLEPTERWAQLVLDSSLDAVVAADPEGRIVGWNRGAEEIFKWSADEAIGRTVEETILPPERVEPYHAAVAKLLAEGPEYVRVRDTGSSRNRDGLVFPVEVATTAIRVEDETVIVNFMRDVTAEQAATDELHRTNELLQALLEAVPVPVNVVDADGCVTLWNHASEETFGWTAGQAVGRFLPCLRPEDVDAFRAHVRGIFEGEALRDAQGRAVCADGKELRLRISAGPVYGPAGEVIGALGVEVDVTEQRRAAAELQETTALLQALFEAMPIPVTVVDADGRVTLWSPAAEREFGWPAEEVLGEIPPMVPPDAYETWQAHCARVMGGETITDIPARRLRRKGSELEVSVSLAPVHGSRGEITGTLGVSLDMTERNRALALLQSGDAKRRLLLATLVRAQEEERQRIAADIHDDSVQVLTALALRLELLRRRIEEPNALADLAEAERTARLAITRLRHLMFELRPPALDRDGLAAALRMHLEQIKHDFGVDFTLEDRLKGEPGGETRALVYRIAQEAVVNAAKHAQCSRVDVRLAGDESAIAVRVADDGRGFLQDGERRNHVGLVFMRERAEMAGGWCRVESTPGQGTVVEFAVPLSGAAGVQE